MITGRVTGPNTQVLVLLVNNLEAGFSIIRKSIAEKANILQFIKNSKETNKGKIRI